jgi:hypothetical protein
MDPTAGEEYHIGDSSRWEGLALGRGDVIDVKLSDAGFDVRRDLWAGFWVKQVFILDGGECTAVLKSLGCTDQDWTRYLSGVFNRKEGRAHFCAHAPCPVPGDYVMHVTRLKMFTMESFDRP